MAHSLGAQACYIRGRLDMVPAISQTAREIKKFLVELEAMPESQLDTILTQWYGTGWRSLVE